MMRWTEGWRRFKRIWMSDSVGAVDDEIQFHFDQKVEEFIAQGLSPEQARRRAEEEFGDESQVRETLHTINERIRKRKQRAEWWEGVAQDLRYVSRTLRRSPAFTIAVVLTLALGLGANAALFSLLDRLYVQTPAGVTQPKEMRRLYQQTVSAHGPYTRIGFSYAEIRELRRVSPPGIELTSYLAETARLGRSIDAPQVGTVYVEGDYFRVSGVQPALGRTFAPDEYRIEGVAMVAVISHSLWQRQFQGDSSIVGREIDLGSHRHIIIGVAAPEFRGLALNVADVWVPMNTIGVLKERKADWFESRNFNGLRVVSRVRVEPAVAVFDVRATEALRRVRIMRDSLSTSYLASIIEARGGRNYEQELKISTRLGGVAAVILLIACANVVNLLLARAANRKREVAVRLALGVSRRRLLTQLLLESSVLAGISAIVALAFAYVGATTLRTLLLPDIKWSDGAINERVAVFTAALAMLTGFAAGLIPALQATRTDLSNAMKGSVRDGGMRRSRLRSSLLVAQAALSVVLLVGAGVFVRSLNGIEAIDTGYDTERLMYATVSFDRELEDRTREIGRRLPEAAERLRSIPGVEEVALATNIPMYGFSFSSLFLPGRDSLPSSNGQDRFLSVVSHGFFSAVGMNVLIGRDFSGTDQASSELVIIVDENMAKNFWPGEDALTKCIIVEKRDMPCRRVVGVVSQSHYSSIVEPPSMHYYLPMAQADEKWKAGVVVMRVEPNQAKRIAPVVTRELSRTFGDWARPRVRTMEEIIAPEMRPWRVGAALFTSAGLLALLVAAVGVYSSIAYTIAQRRHEMGVRVALGAQARNIIRLVIGEGVRVVALGVFIGLVIALALGRLVASMLYETSPRDPVVLTVASITLLTIALVACLIPALRASNVNPVDALKSE